MIKLLLITGAVAMAPRASRPKKIRGVREDRWSFDILTKWKKDGEHAQIVATDARGEVGWFEVLRSRGGNVLHAPLKGEPAVERAFGTNVMVNRTSASAASPRLYLVAPRRSCASGTSRNFC